MEDKQVEEIKRHFDVVVEGLRDEIKLVGEGHDIIRKEIQTFREEVKEEFKEVKSAIKFSYADLDRRITFLENKYENVERRLRKLETSR